MTIPLYSVPLNYLKRPFWSRGSWNKCWLENTGKHISGVIHVFIFVSVSVDCDSRDINCWTIVWIWNHWGYLSTLVELEHAFDARILNVRISENGESQLESLRAQLILARVSWVFFLYAFMIQFCVVLFQTPLWTSDFDFYLRRRKKLSCRFWWVRDLDSFRALFGEIYFP